MFGEKDKCSRMFEHQGTNIQKMSPTSNFSHQQPQIFTKFKSPKSLLPFIIHTVYQRNKMKSYPKCALKIFGCSSIFGKIFC